MKQVSRMFRIRSRSENGQHHALAAFKAAEGVVVRMGEGGTREDAISAAIGRRRWFYESSDVERDLLVAELRGEDIVLTAEGELLHHCGA